MQTIVHPRVFERHPELSEDDIVTAWENCSIRAVRTVLEREVRLGFDCAGRELEMIGVMLGDGWLVYHAMTPPSKKMRNEIDGLRRRYGRV